MRGSDQVFLAKRELNFLKCQNDDLTENTNIFLDSFTCLFWSLNWRFFYENTGLSFTIMSYIIERMLCLECCRIYIKKRFECASVDAYFSKAGEKISVLKSIRMHVDKTLELTEGVGKETTRQRDTWILSILQHAISRRTGMIVV